MKPDAKAVMEAPHHHIIDILRSEELVNGSLYIYIYVYCEGNAKSRFSQSQKKNNFNTR